MQDAVTGSIYEKMEYDATFEMSLNDKQMQSLKAFKVARNNPFSKLQRNNTKRILGEMEQITVDKGNLPVLEAWLEKKSTSIAQGYRKRWVVVKGSYLLWSDIQRDINNPKDVKEREKWNNSINLMSITSVEAVTAGKTQKKFKIFVGRGGIKNKRRDYLWKCATKEDRNYWVAGLKKHMAHVRSVISYLGTK